MKGSMDKQQCCDSQKCSESVHDYLFKIVLHMPGTSHRLVYQGIGRIVTDKQLVYRVKPEVPAQTQRHHTHIHNGA
jgi:oligoribonuclease (3'-5' exoribonuclease)